MAGITILSSTLNNVDGFALTFRGMLLITIAVIGALLIFVIFDNEYTLYISLGFLALLTIIGLVNFLEVKYSYHVYTVAIEDSVKMNDFMDKYQIIEREGRVYKVTPWEELPDGRPESETYLQTNK